MHAFFCRCACLVLTHPKSHRCVHHVAQQLCLGFTGRDQPRVYCVRSWPPVTGSVLPQMCANARGQSYACGQASLKALQERVAKSPVRCTVRAADQYGRAVSKCGVLDGRYSEDLGAFLVKNGQAVAYR